MQTIVAHNERYRQLSVTHTRDGAIEESNYDFSLHKTTCTKPHETTLYHVTLHKTTLHYTIPHYTRLNYTIPHHIA